MGWRKATPEEAMVLGGGQVSLGVNRTEGNGKIGPKEATTQESQLADQQKLRIVLAMLAQQEQFNRKLPTGRFEAHVNEAGQQFPSSWRQGDAIPTYQSMMGLQQKMLKPAIMVPPLLWLLSDEARAVNAQRFIAADWDLSLPPAKAAEKAGAPIAWLSIARMPIEPK